MRFRLRLFPKFIILLCIISVLPAAFIGRMIVDINNDSLQYEVQRYHLRLARSLSQQLDERLLTLRSQIEMAVSAFQNPDVGWDERQYLLSLFIDTSLYIGIVAAITPDGQEIMKVYDPLIAPEVDANPELISHVKLPLFQKFKKGGNQTLDVFREGKNTYANIYFPFVTPGGKNAMFVKLSLNDLMSTVSKESIGLTGCALYVNQKGELLSEPPNANPESHRTIKDSSIVKTALIGSDASREFTGPAGDEWIGASSRVDSFGGAIITQQSRKEAFAKSVEGERRAVIIVLLTIILAILAALILARMFTKPLLAVTRVARGVDLSEGRFPDPVDIHTRDEIEELAETFNGMIEKLKGYADLQVEKLIIEQKKTEAIIFSINDGIIMTDFQGKIQLISHQARRLFRLEDDVNPLGEPLWKYLPNPDLKTAFMEILTKPEQKRRIEVKIPYETKDAFFAVSAEEVRTPGKNETLGVVTVMHDITLEKELDSMKEEFLHSITHDLRNPLTAIRGFIRLFATGQTGQLNEVQTKMFSTMDKASLRLLNMVNDILDLARLDSGRLKLQLDSLQIFDVASRALELFMPQAQTNKIKLKLDITGDKEDIPDIIADPSLIERVFTNLIGNATKFTPEDGTITIRIEPNDETLRCAVIDTGDGIPPDYLDKVFDKFRQVDSHYKGGAGLGLTICKRIVEAHHGRIWVESEVGKGSSFIFELPCNLKMSKEEKAA